MKKQHNGTVLISHFKGNGIEKPPFNTRLLLQLLFGLPPWISGQFFTRFNPHTVKGAISTNLMGEFLIFLIEEKLINLPKKRAFSLKKFLTRIFINANICIQLNKTTLKAWTLRKKMVAYLG